MQKQFLNHLFDNFSKKEVNLNFLNFTSVLDGNKKMLCAFPILIAFDTFNFSKINFHTHLSC